MSDRETPTTTETPGFAPATETPEAEIAAFARKDVAKPAHREPAGKTRILQWVGEAPRTDANGRIDMRFERTRQAPTPGHSVLVLRAGALGGLSRDYHWGPKAPFLAEVKRADAALILKARGETIRDVTDDPAFRDKAVRAIDDDLYQPAIDSAKLRRFRV